MEATTKVGRVEIETAEGTSDLRTTTEVEVAPSTLGATKGEIDTITTTRRGQITTMDQAEIGGVQVAEGGQTKVEKVGTEEVTNEMITTGLTTKSTSGIGTLGTVLTIIAKTRMVMETTLAARTRKITSQTG